MSNRISRGVVTPPRAAVAAAVALVLVGASCSSGDDDGAPVTAPATSVAEPGTDDMADDDMVDDDSRDDGDGGSGAGADTTGDVVAETTVATESSGTDDDGDDGGDGDDVPVTEPTLPQVGVPGLDAEDAVCRAWSRFAGSFQVAAVAASFADRPVEAARLEVVASPVVATAVDEMIANWPESLADEAELAADRLIGPYARRSERALDLLLEAGADAADLDRLSEIWLDSLAVRDPAEVLPDLVLPDDLARLVDVAAADFDDQVVPIPADPSLVTDVEVPATEAFLAETCPDRGTLAGGEPVE